MRKKSIHTLFPAFSPYRAAVLCGIALLAGHAVPAQPSQSNVFGGDGIFSSERIQLVYTRAELLATGLLPGNQIDSLCFAISQRNSTADYSAFSVSMYYTTTNFAFPSITQGWAPQVSTGGLHFSGLLNLSVPGPYYVPATGGLLTIPLTNCFWTGSVNDLVIDLCWDSFAGMPADSTVATLLPDRKVARLRRLPATSSIPACSMNFTLPNTVSNVSFWRPDVCFIHSPGPAAVPLPAAPSGLVIESVSAAGDHLAVWVHATAPESLSCRVFDMAGRTLVVEAKGVAASGRQVLALPAPREHGVYVLQLESPYGAWRRLFIR